MFEIPVLCGLVSFPSKHHKDIANNKNKYPVHITKQLYTLPASHIIFVRNNNYYYLNSKLFLIFTCGKRFVGNYNYY